MWVRSTYRGAVVLAEEKCRGLQAVLFYPQGIHIYIAQCHRDDHTTDCCSEVLVTVGRLEHYLSVIV